MVLSQKSALLNNYGLRSFIPIHFSTKSRNKYNIPLLNPKNANIYIPYIR